MKQPIYAIEDRLVGFHGPMLGVNEEQMLRDFSIYLSNKNEKERADLSLYYLGEFDTESGQIEPCVPARFIERG